MSKFVRKENELKINLSIDCLAPAMTEEELDGSSMVRTSWACYLTLIGCLFESNAEAQAEKERQARAQAQAAEIQAYVTQCQ